jgi:hypothetical protein
MIQEIAAGSLTFLVVFFLAVIAFENSFLHISRNNH